MAVGGEGSGVNTCKNSTCCIQGNSRIYLLRSSFIFHAITIKKITMEVFSQNEFDLDSFVDSSAYYKHSFSSVINSQCPFRWSMTTTPLTIHKVNVKVLKLTGAVSLDINIYHGEEKVGKCAPFPIGECTDLRIS